jgi:hypothetical protein
MIGTVSIYENRAGLAEQLRDGLQIHYTWVQIPRPAPFSRYFLIQIIIIT